MAKHLESEDYIKIPIDIPVSVELNTYFTGEATADIDNIHKCVFDSVKGILYDDDKQIKRSVCTVNEHYDQDGFELIIKPIKN